MSYIITFIHVCEITAIVSCMGKSRVVFFSPQKRNKNEEGVGNAAVTQDELGTVGIRPCDVSKKNGTVRTMTCDTCI